MPSTPWRVPKDRLKFANIKCTQILTSAHTPTKLQIYMISTMCTIPAVCTFMIIRKYLNKLGEFLTWPNVYEEGGQPHVCGSKARSSNKLWHWCFASQKSYLVNHLMYRSPFSKHFMMYTAGSHQQLCCQTQRHFFFPHTAPMSAAYGYLTSVILILASGPLERLRTIAGASTILVLSSRGLLPDEPAGIPPALPLVNSLAAQSNCGRGGVVLVPFYCQIFLSKYDSSAAKGGRVVTRQEGH